MSVSMDIRDQVAWITMDDGKVNAVNFELVDALLAAIDEAEANAKALVLVGRPGKFCAGFDLKVIQGGDAQAVRTLLDRGGEVALRLLESPLPTIGLCSGHALAMGALFLLACDTRIGVRGEFKIGLNETAIGLALPVFGIELPRIRLAPQDLTAAVVQARLYGPEDAARVGFLTDLADAETVLEETAKRAAALAALPGDAYAANNQHLHKGAIAAIRASLGFDG